MTAMITWAEGESRLLTAKATAARRLERCLLLLERHAADLASRALATHADIDATHARRLAVARNISSANGEIEDAQQKAEEWDHFYESKRKEMEEFRPSSPQPPSTLVKFSVEVPPLICQECYQTTLLEYSKRFE
ncbi:uncharacterized protein LOC119350229 [Triticum dicoccoides]|uniref:uncharacterized protein LOC119350229 n=1 Tax=Triticum dicoccoides TaxID=85692 RepID=UPI0018905792|nr:uncharacterized protein LOC119350229 [Triticum dicoccoides]